jgi:hypothetical protein
MRKFGDFDRPSDRRPGPVGARNDPHASVHVWLCRLPDPESSRAASFFEGSLIPARDIFKGACPRVRIAWNRTPRAVLRSTSVPAPAARAATRFARRECTRGSGVRWNAHPVDRVSDPIQVEDPTGFMRSIPLGFRISNLIFNPRVADVKPGDFVLRVDVAKRGTLALKEGVGR